VAETRRFRTSDRQPCRPRNTLNTRKRKNTADQVGHNRREPRSPSLQDSKFDPFGSPPNRTRFAICVLPHFVDLRLRAQRARAIHKKFTPRPFRLFTPPALGS